MWGWIKFEATGRQSGQRDRDTMLIQNKEMERSWYVMICYDMSLDLWSYKVAAIPRTMSAVSMITPRRPCHACDQSTCTCWKFHWGRLADFPVKLPSYREKSCLNMKKKTSWSMQHDYFPMFFSIISLLFPPMISLCFPYDVHLFRLLFPYDVPMIVLFFTIISLWFP